MGTKDDSVTFKLKGRGRGCRQDIEVVDSHHVIKSDAMAVFGGADAYPSPLVFTLASLISCNQITAEVVAKDHGIVIRSYEFSVFGQFDPALMIDDNEDAYDSLWGVQVEARVETDVSLDQVKTFGQEVDRRCPATALFRRAGTGVFHDWIKV